MSNKSFEEIRKTIEKIGNPNSLPITTIYARVKRGQSIESAILEPKTDRYKKSYNKLYFENSSNPHNLKWNTVRSRMRKGETFEEAMSYPLEKVHGSKERAMFENYENPYGLNWKAVKSRMRRGETFEEAMSYPLRVRKFKERIMFENHENPYDLDRYVVRYRMRRGESFEEAMSYPSGANFYQKFKNGWVMYEGQWTNVDNLEMIFDEETTENMIKSGVKVEKLFTKIER